MTSLIKCAVVDIQGIFIPEFFPKEISIRRNYTSEHFIIRTPTTWCNLSHNVKRTNCYVKKHIHGIAYNYKDKFTIDYYQLEAVLKNLNVNVVFVKGHQKAQFLEKLLSERVSIVNLENNADCPKLTWNNNNVENLCYLHSTNPLYQCALRNVNLLDNYLNSSYKSFSS